MPGFHEEPFFPKRSCKLHEECLEVEEEIRRLMTSELFAVLATQGEGQPYTSIISFAVTQDLKHLVFCTSQETRKYHLLLKSPQVALLVDDRSQRSLAINQISAVTITGKSFLSDTSANPWDALLLDKHPYLKSFLESPSTVLVVVDIYRYFLVRRFQEVSEWNPKKD